MPIPPGRQSGLNAPDSQHQSLTIYIREGMPGEQGGPCGCDDQCFKGNAAQNVCGREGATFTLGMVTINLFREQVRKRQAESGNYFMNAAAPEAMQKYATVIHLPKCE
ncbi:hypothetical protein GCM10027046_30640 [Uliginosibacterium flavum]